MAANYSDGIFYNSHRYSYDGTLVDDSDNLLEPTGSETSALDSTGAQTGGTEPYEQATPNTDDLEALTTSLEGKEAASGNMTNA